MKVALFILLSFWAAPAFAQQDTAAVKDAVAQLEQALVSRDSATLLRLLHPDLVFGHSNGWIQHQADVLRDMNSGYLVYQHFKTETLAIERFRDRAIVKAFVRVLGEREAKPFDVRLFVIQEWRQTKRGWQMILRQGARQQ